jgi:UPF0755 protein
MSRVTNEINKVTGTIISLAAKLILYAVIILLLVEGCTRGYAFGHAIFYATAMEAAPGRDRSVTITEGQPVGDTARMLKDMGLISSDLILQIQMRFYDYEFHPGTYVLNTSMTSKEILQILDEGNQEVEESVKAVPASTAETTKAEITTAETEETTADSRESGTTKEVSVQPEVKPAEESSGETAGEDVIEIQIN